MYPDKDRPSTWKSFRESLCSDCRANCCTMPVEVKWMDLLRLGWITEDETSPKKVAKKLLKEKKIISFRAGEGLYTLSRRPNGDCFLLNEKTRLCAVYHIRPEVCRSFPAIGPRPGFCPYEKK